MYPSIYRGREHRKHNWKTLQLLLDLSTEEEIHESGIHESGLSALHVSSRYGKKQEVQMLLEKGANVNVRKKCKLVSD